MVRGQEFHSIIEGIFDEVNGLNISEQLQVNCPRCQERDGLPYPDDKFNLEINTAKRMFRCWKCEEPRFSGSLGKLIRLYGSHSDYELYKSYGGGVIGFYDEYSDDIKPSEVFLPEEMILFANMDSRNLDHFEAYNYLVNERKISRDIILKYRLGFCTTGRYAKRIIIPSYDVNGDVNYFVSRTYDKSVKKGKYDNPKSDKSRIIFNEGFINWDSTIYLVEGVFEMLSFPVNSIPLLGKDISNTLYMELKKYLPNVVILLDPDAYKNAINIYYTIQNIYIGCEEKVKIVKLKTNEDLDELRTNYGINEVIKTLRTARDLNVDDYFELNLSKPYEPRKRYETYSGHTKW
jgi:hypothetical protein